MPTSNKTLYFCMRVSLGGEGKMPSFDGLNLCIDFLAFDQMEFRLSVVVQCACLSLVAGLLSLKANRTQIGLRVVNGVTCTFRCADVRWIEDMMFFVFRMYVYTFHILSIESIEKGSQYRKSFGFVVACNHISLGEQTWFHCSKIDCDI